MRLSAPSETADMKVMMQNSKANEPLRRNDIQMTNFWDIAPYNRVEIDRRSDDKLLGYCTV
jgi:hypothetical protein